MYKIKITGDSTMDLSKELLQQYDMDVMPLYINMEEKSFKDGIDIVPDDIYSYVNQTGKLSKTSAPTISAHISFIFFVACQFSSFAAFSGSA